MGRTYEVINHQNNMKKKDQSYDEHASGGPNMLFPHDREASNAARPRAAAARTDGVGVERCTCASADQP